MAKADKPRDLREVLDEAGQHPDFKHLLIVRRSNGDGFDLSYKTPEGSFQTLVCPPEKLGAGVDTMMFLSGRHRGAKVDMDADVAARRALAGETRYWFHPESDCYYTTGPEGSDDPLSHEVDRAEYFANQTVEARDLQDEDEDDEIGSLL